MGVIISLVGLYCRTHILRGRCSCAFGLCEFGAVDVAVAIAVDILLVGVVADAEGDSGDGVDVESKEPDRGRVKIVIPVF